MKAFEDYLKSTSKDGKRLWQWAKQPQHSVSDDIQEDPVFKELGVNDEIVEATLIEAKYEGYLGRQEQQVAAFRKLENIKLVDNLDYHAVPHLRFEAKEKLSTFRPCTLGQAGRIGGITPADITVIQIYLKKNKGF